MFTAHQKMKKNATWKKSESHIHKKKNKTSFQGCAILKAKSVHVSISKVAQFFAQSLSIFSIFDDTLFLNKIKSKSMLNAPIIREQQKIPGKKRKERKKMKKKTNHGFKSSWSLATHSCRRAIILLEVIILLFLSNKCLALNRFILYLLYGVVRKNTVQNGHPLSCSIFQGWQPWTNKYFPTIHCCTST